MNLKTATLFAIAGLALRLLTTIGLTLRNWTSAPTPPLEAWLSMSVSVALHFCLLMFFITLYRKQQPSNG